MCWIIFANTDKIIDIFTKQKDRGADSVGIVYSKEPNSATFYKLGPAKDGDIVAFETYTSMVQARFNPWDIEWNVLFHHRKSSIGKNDLDNAHPHRGDKFYLMQNGTAKDMRTWWDIELIDRSKSDTFCLLQYLERHCDTLEDAAALLERVTWSIGSIFVADDNGRILFFSDKTREAYINIENDKVVLISSKNPDDLSTEYWSKWHIIFDFEGNIISQELSVTNEKKTKPPVQSYGSAGYYAPYDQTTRKYKRYKGFDDLDDLLLLVTMTGWVMSKKEHKAFLEGYDDFKKNVDWVVGWMLTPGNQYIYHKDAAADKWHRKYRTVLKMMKDWEIEPGDATWETCREFGGMVEFRKSANKIIDEMRKGRIKDAMYFDDKWNLIDLQLKQTVPLTPLNEDVPEVDLIAKEDSLKQLEIDVADVENIFKNNDLQITMWDIVVFDDGTLGEAIDEWTVMIHDAYHNIVHEVLTGKKCVHVQSNLPNWLKGADNIPTKKYITNVNPKWI